MDSLDRCPDRSPRRPPARRRPSPGDRRARAPDGRVPGRCSASRILVFRTFAAEAYIVPTGSMAPTLLGNHKEVACPNCGIRFALGLDEEGRAGRPVCRNCGQADFDGASARRMQRRPAAGAEGPLRLPAAEALGGRRLPLPGRAVAGVRQAGGRPARRVDPDRRRRRLHRRPDRPQDAAPSSGRCGSWSTTTTSCPRDADRYPALGRASGRAGPARSPSGWRPRGTAFVHEPTARAARPSRPTGSNIATGTRTGAVGAGPRLQRVQRRRPAGREPRDRPDARGARRRRGPTSGPSASGSARAATGSWSRIPVDGRGASEVRRNGPRARR